MRGAFWTAEVLRRFFDGSPKIELHIRHAERHFAVHARTENALATLPDASISHARGLFCELYRFKIDTVNVVDEFETNGDW